jgi:hypothetical protein
MSLHYEIDTITSSLNEISTRISTLVEQGKDLPGDVYVELVAAERTVGTLLRRLERLHNKLT